MFTKAKARIVTCFINLFSLALVLFFPGSSTFASVFAILALCDAVIIADKVKTEKKESKTAIEIINTLSILVITIISALVLFLTFSAQVTKDEVLNAYYILFNTNMAFCGNGQVDYQIFAIVIAIIVVVFEIVEVIKAFFSSKSATWEEIAQAYIR